MLPLTTATAHTDIAQPKTAFAFFHDLVTGKLQPNKRWSKPRFRTKYCLRSLLFPATTLRYLRALVNLPDMPQAIEQQGLLPVKIHRPYLCAGLSVSERADALVEHYQFVQTLAEPALRQLLQANTDTVLVDIHGKNGEHFSVTCCSGRFDREGEVTLIFKWDDIQLALLSFSIIRKNGVETLFIGGLQGASKQTGNDVIRDATKACYGLFPKRILMEVVFLLAGQCGISSILAVGDHTHVFYSLRYRFSKKDYFFASYSEFWASLHGQQTRDGLYSLPLAMPRKSLEDIASKKRSEYRRRYELLDALMEQVSRQTTGSR